MRAAGTATTIVAALVVAAPMGCNHREQHPPQTIPTGSSTTVNRVHWAVESSDELWLTATADDGRLILVQFDRDGQEVNWRELGAGRWAVISPAHERVVIGVDDGVVVSDLAGETLGSFSLPSEGGSHVLSEDRLLFTWGSSRRPSGFAIIDIVTPELVASYDLSSSLYHPYCGPMSKLMVVPRHPSQEEPGYSLSRAGEPSRLDRGLAGHTVIGRLGGGAWVLSDVLGTTASVRVEGRRIVLPRDLRIHWRHVVSGDCIVYEDEHGATAMNLRTGKSLALEVPSDDDRDRLDILRIHGSDDVLVHRNAEYWVIDTTGELPRVLEWLPR